MGILNFLQQSFLFFLLLSGLTACQKEKSRISTHDNSVATTQKLNNADSINQEANQDLNLNSKVSDYLKNFNSNSNYDEMLRISRDFLKTVARWKHSYTESSDFMRNIELAGRLMVSSGAKVSGLYTEFRQSYKEALLYGCDVSYEVCHQVSIFRWEPVSLEALANLISETTKISEYYGLLHLGFEMQQQNPSARLRQLYIAKAKEWESYLNDKRDSERLQRHRSVLESFLKFGNDSGLQVSLQTNSLINSNQNQTGRLAKEVVKNLNKNDVFKSDGALQDWVGAELKLILDSRDSVLAQWITLNTSNSEILKKFSIKKTQDEISSDIYVLILDKVYKQEWSYSEATNFIRKMNLSSAELVSATEFYMTTRFLYLSRFINTSMYHHLFKRDKLDSSQLLRDALSKSTELRTYSINYIEQSKSVFALLQGIAGENAKNSKIYEFLRNIEANIKLSITYPQMMALSYYLSVYDFKEKFTSFFGLVFEVESKTIINTVFQGGLNLVPWFAYSPADRFGLESSNVAVAYEMALKMQTFADFQIDATNYLGEVLGRIYKDRAVKVEDFSNSIKLRQDSREMTIFNLLCQGKEPHIVPASEFVNHILGYSFYKAIAPVPANMNRTEMSRLLPVAYSYNTYLETGRVDWGEFFEKVEFLVQLTKKETHSEIVDNSLQKLLDEKRKWLDSVRLYEQELKRHNRCMSKILSEEVTVRLGLYNYEKNYLQHIHQLYHQLKKENATAAEIEKKIVISKTSPVDLKEQIVNGVLRISAGGTLWRLKTYLEKGLPIVDKNLIPVHPLWQISFPQTFNKLEEKTGVFSEVNSVELDFSLSSEEFVRQGLWEIFYKWMRWYKSAATSYEPISGGDYTFTYHGLSQLQIYLLSASSEQDEHLGQELLDLPAMIYKMYGIQASESAFLEQALVTKSKFHKYKILTDNYIENPDGGPLLAPYDFVFKLAAGEYLLPAFATGDVIVAGGDDYRQTPDPTQTKAEIKVNKVDENAKSRFTAAIQFAAFYRNWNPNQLFGAGQDLKNSYQQIYSRFFTKEEAKLRKLYDKIKEREAADLAAGKLMRFEFERGRVYQGPYVSEITYKAAISNYENFHKMTGHIFKIPEK